MNKPEVRPAAEAKSPAKKMTKEELSKQIKRMRDRDAELVVGMFKNLENPATGGSRGSVVFSYKYYPGDEIVRYELLDGYKYTLPRGVARHLNNQCFYREHQHIKGNPLGPEVREAYNADGRLDTTSTSYQASRKIHRYAFHSMEYMDEDIDMYPTNLIEVTASP